MVFAKNNQNSRGKTLGFFLVRKTLEKELKILGKRRKRGQDKRKKAVLTMKKRFLAPLPGEVFANGHPHLTDVEYQTFFALCRSGKKAFLKKAVAQPQLCHLLC